ncbi:hypothetical protein [Vitiosangium sp. GDMCC 1.1324]|uniref:hypothetical protein n=1 Tax=Vitiosangium sp. (strain GDMCC 1.1324) TaxID=2138576 RepID=UPI000D339C2B|nr:hypothetical protein [Vitiosangium sp. GDMCC 1.1324]PTL79093.1 hypothetical protein DAT35_36400 [Vitiosangium sp. GDMCC 1.1324]
MSSIIAEDMRQTLYIAKSTGPDFRGTETYGPAGPAPCRCEPSGRMVRAADGRQVVAEFFILTTAKVTVDDIVWPPGEDHTKVGASRKPLKAAPIVDLETGQVDHYEVSL